MPREERKPPGRAGRLFRTLIRVLSEGELRRVHFTSRRLGMERLGKREPCLILMNHSSFIDLKIASALLYPRPFHIVCTSDGFVGKEWLMRRIGCIPTRKFMTDPHLVKDMMYVLMELKSSVLMYPEASYSFDGTATPLPEGLGKCLKILKVPVVFIRTYGAFTYDPLYNNLRKRKVDVSAEISYFLSPAEIEEKTPEELNEILKEAFTFDHFRWQQENRIRVDEPFRADDLNRVLYKCPHCRAEGQMKGDGICSYSGLVSLAAGMCAAGIGREALRDACAGGYLHDSGYQMYLPRGRGGVGSFCRRLSSDRLRRKTELPAGTAPLL